MSQNSRLISASMAWALFCSAAMGCGGAQKKNEVPVAATEQPPKAEAAAETPKDPPKVLLRLDAKSGGKEAHELQPGESLRSGDQMAINVAVNQLAYVYVAFASPGSPPQIIFPKGGDKQLSPDQPLRIPANPDKWFTLDKQAGQEDVLVYASNKPISSVELTNLVNADAEAARRAAARRAARVATRPKPAKGKGEDPLAAPDARALQLSGDDEGDGESSGSGNPEIVSKKISIPHK